MIEQKLLYNSIAGLLSQDHLDQQVKNLSNSSFSMPQSIDSRIASTILPKHELNSGNTSYTDPRIVELTRENGGLRLQIKYLQKQLNQLNTLYRSVYTILDDMQLRFQICASQLAANDLELENFYNVNEASIRP